MAKGGDGLGHCFTAIFTGSFPTAGFGAAGRVNFGPIAISVDVRQFFQNLLHVRFLPEGFISGQGIGFGFVLQKDMAGITQLQSAIFDDGDFLTELDIFNPFKANRLNTVSHGTFIVTNNLNCIVFQLVSHITNIQGVSFCVENQVIILTENLLVYNARNQDSILIIYIEIDRTAEFLNYIDQRILALEFFECIAGINKVIIGCSRSLIHTGKGRI